MTLTMHGAATASLALLLAGCNGTFTNDLETDPPADPAIASVNVDLVGVEFQTADGGTETLEFRNPEPVDLLDFGSSSDAMRMFTSEELPPNDYTGIRLLFDEKADATVVDDNGGKFPIEFEDGAYAPVDFTVEDQKRSQEDLTLGLDLRQSLTFDGTGDVYTLKPVLRAVRTADAASLNGQVSITCPSGSTLAEGGAVYLFAGADVTADDIDGATPEPYATTSLTQDVFGGPFRYTLRTLAAGDYTIAATCQGDTDVVTANDDLTFQGTTNVKLDDGEVLRLDVD